MSTRSEIQFDEIDNSSGKVKIYSARIYRHSDGYPKSVIEDLYRYSKDKQFGLNSDVEYTTANFLYDEKRIMEKMYGATPASYGYGVQNAKKKWYIPNHGDIEYTYNVTLGSEPAVEIYDVRKKKMIFDGTLERAYKEYVRKEKATVMSDEEINMKPRIKV